VGGDANVITQFFERQDGSFHINQHLTFADVKGVGENSGIEYRASSNFNTIAFDFDTVGADSISRVVAITLVSVGPVHQPNLTIQTVLHITINANGDLTSQIEDFRAVCHGA
jgi:hypothetical protein